METILNFDDCISKASKTKHLVLGNGFSVDLFPEIFNYKKLAEKINDPNIKALFTEFNTSDFEFVLLKLQESLKVLSYYDDKKTIYNKVKDDTQKLKKILIHVIAASHPGNPTYITDDQYNSCFLFLKHFEKGRKYTFNYDLILYWVYMHYLDNKDTDLSMDDGFRTDANVDSMVTWEIGREHQQTMYYIHGAMHIFKNENAVIEKYTWRNGDKTIGQQVKESMEANKFPVFISEGTTDHKLKRIKENGYLSRGFSSLKSISGDLFIFGHSIRDEDNHIFDIINSNNKLKKIFISIYGNEKSEENVKIISKVNDWRKNYDYPGREYVFYHSISVKVWRK